ncbi:MAG: transcription termination factor Rho [Gammaproteobacteria bacterium AqS3]|nr:transcription termination factor Rho [Gammaproteobacteria bacterium AqS3]
MSIDENNNLEVEATAGERPARNSRNRGRSRRRSYRPSAPGSPENQQGEESQQYEERVPQEPEPLPDGIEISSELSVLRGDSVERLHELCQQLGLETGRARKVDLICSIARRLARAGNEIFGEGVLDIVSGRDNRQNGFLRSREASYTSSQDDIYVDGRQINRHRLRPGDVIRCSLRISPKSFSLDRIETVNGVAIDELRRRPVFEELTPTFPDQAMKLEQGTGSSDDISARTIDLIAPIGRGQRGLIVSPPKAGKTVLLHAIAQSILRNNDDIELIVLLIDERPEEVTEMERTVRSDINPVEVIASTFDEPATRHVQVANMVIEKSRRMVENGKHVVILLDSLTRLARAYNTVQPSSGRVLTGGVDANALERPKRFFGAARNIDGGGSLTILATALIDTGSKMDEVIYEEFKGTGNMEVHLDRRIAEKRVFPAINIRRSGTRREDLVMEADVLNNIWILRRLLHDMDDLPAMELLSGQLKQTRTNEALLNSMKGK